MDGGFLLLLLWHTKFVEFGPSLSITTIFRSTQEYTSKMKSALVLLAAAASVSAHSTWQELWVGSTDQVDKCARTVKDNNPISGVTSPDMFCGRSPKSTSGVCEVAGKPPNHFECEDSTDIGE